jgi:phosphoribosylformylglycinamidine cyclo-ligase
MSQSPPLSYRAAGVDIDAGNALVRRIAPLAARTATPGVMRGIGGFGALFDLGQTGFRDPLLVSTTDGVGTKLKLAIAWDGHDRIGIDLVAMSVNDLVVQGATPLFFLDYFATGRLDVDVAARVVAGIARGCEEAGAALVGGETAEMPGMYADGDYDLAGFAVGAVERGAVVDGRGIRPGDVVLGLASSGPHANGYSLVRKVLEGIAAPESVTLAGRPLPESLLAPTRIYVRPLLAALGQHEILGLAHITGGGLIENLPRCLPAGTAARLDGRAWPVPEPFPWLARSGGIAPLEMLRTFNCGIGMAAVARPEVAGPLAATLTGLGERVFRLGEVIATAADEPPHVTFSALPPALVDAAA